MLQILFGDDEHTAADGPYPRIMRTRKWIYLSSAVAALLAHRLYSETSASEALGGVIAFPAWLIGQVVVGGVLYLLCQYGLLVFQLRSIYDIVLSERLSYRRADELAGARQRIDSAVEKLRDHRRSRVQAAAASRNELAQRVYDAEEARRQAEDQPDTVLKIGDQTLPGPRSMAIKMADAELKNARKAQESYLRQSEEPSLDPTEAALEVEIEEAKLHHDRLAEQDPAARPGYRKAEVAIDLLRVGLPAVVGFAALVSLIVSQIAI